MCNERIIVSTLPKTWILDLDGTIVEHNGYKKYGKDVFLEGAKEFLLGINAEDMIVFITSRKKEYSRVTEAFLMENGIRYDYIIYEAPYGERILINDRKPYGLATAISINLERNSFIPRDFIVYNENL